MEGQTHGSLLYATASYHRMGEQFMVYMQMTIRVSSLQVCNSCDLINQDTILDFVLLTIYNR